MTVFPKCRTPSELGDLRNISWTMLPSIIVMSSTGYRRNSPAGIINMEGSRDAASNTCWWTSGMKSFGIWKIRGPTMMITAIDYAKAFNQLSFQHCLFAFACKGASMQTFSLLATFLSNCIMSVRVSNTWSAPDQCMEEFRRAQYWESCSSTLPPTTCRTRMRTPGFLL